MSDKGHNGIKAELIQVRKSRDRWKRMYHELNYRFQKFRMEVRRENETK